MGAAARVITTTGGKIAPKVFKETVKGGKLAQLTAALGGMNPFTYGNLFKTALGVGTAATGASAIYGLPGMIERGILEDSKNAEGGYDVNPLVQLLGGDRFSQEKLKAKGQQRDLVALKDKQPIQTRSALTGIEPVAGDTLAGYMARTKGAADKINQKDRLQDFATDPVIQQMKTEREIAANRLFSQDNRALDLQQLQIQGGIDSNNLAMRIAQENNKERMHVYSQDLQQKRENDRYRTTAGLIGGLSALGAGVRSLITANSSDRSYPLNQTQDLLQVLCCVIAFDL